MQWVATRPMLSGVEKERWRVGAVTPLAQTEEAPLLGQLPEGKSVLTLECGMYRAAAVPHTPSECAHPTRIAAV